MNWQQLRAIFWLRWRLTWNQLNRGNGMNLVLSGLFVVGGYSLAIAASFLGFFLGWKVIPATSAEVLLIIWDGFCGFFFFSWLVGLLNELQRSEVIDLQRLMHLPVSLPHLFTINYLASLVTPSVILALPGLLAVSAGMILGGGVRYLLVPPLVVTFLFMVTAWSYYLRGWLVALMVNQRRKRSITVLITVAVILLVQGPNLYFNVIRGGAGRRHQRTAPISAHEYANAPATGLAHSMVPPLWLPNGVYQLRQDSYWPAIAGAFGMGFLGWLGIRRAFRSTLNHYTGTSGPRSATVSRPSEPAPASSNPVPGAAPSPSNALSRKRRMVEWRIPGLSEDTAALTWTSVLNLLRAPEMRMAMLSPLVMLVFFAFLVAPQMRNANASALSGFAPTFLIAMLFFGIVQLLLNQFGFDRHGFRSIVLLPTSRKHVLLAKNLSFFPLIAIPLALVLVALPWVAHTPFSGVVAGAFQMVTMYMLVCTLGNVFSIGAPFRVHATSLKPSKNSPKTVFLLLMCHFLYPVLCLPIALPPAAEFFAADRGWFENLPINLILSFAVFVCAGLIYFSSLEPLGRWFEKREKQMLEVLTQEVE